MEVRATAPAAGCAAAPRVAVAAAAVVPASRPAAGLAASHSTLGQRCSTHLRRSPLPLLLLAPCHPPNKCSCSSEHGEKKKKKKKSVVAVGLGLTWSHPRCRRHCRPRPRRRPLLAWQCLVRWTGRTLCCPSRKAGWTRRWAKWSGRKGAPPPPTSSSRSSVQSDFQCLRATATTPPTPKLQATSPRGCTSANLAPSARSQKSSKQAPCRGRAAGARPKAKTRSSKRLWCGGS
mmetsp:Transcript_46727/g.92462  ORF Transcript_46727/g.92462 Transcript_46727/m.92462 type:complete len:233 (+) Transcript_46727:730-1428(+)